MNEYMFLYYRINLICLGIIYFGVASEYVTTPSLINNVTNWQTLTEYIEVLYGTVSIYIFVFCLLQNSPWKSTMALVEDSREYIP